MDDRDALITLDERIRTLLPLEYQDAYEEMEPTPMRSAGLKFGDDGRVAWDEMWGSFCDLAMAGGPPHKGTLLEPPARTAIDAAPDRHAAVVAEICRGITLATTLPAQPSPSPGWVRVTCADESMAEWLLRAIAMENVAVRRHGNTIDLPAGPDFRLEKEIKNVVTVISKTSHYWSAHMPRVQQRVIANLFAELADESPLVEPAAGWRGVACASVRDAVWMMRALVASNVLSRREGTSLFVPIDPASDPDGAIVTRALARVHRLLSARDRVQE